ncbi:MAG: SH3 domain-containing protein [Pseudomonadota bacterium]
MTRLFAGAVLLLAAWGAHAFDFKTVGPAPVIFYDVPSLKGGKLFVAPRGMPVEVMLSYGEWVKVRDVSGEMAWTEARGLSSKRSVVVRTAGARLRALPDETLAPIMTADKGVVLELIEPQGTAWAKVRHRDGIIAYVKAIDIWGI